MSSSEAYRKARELIDEAHKQDPLYIARQAHSTGSSSTAKSDITKDDGSLDDDEVKQDELAYADAMERWITTLINDTPNAESRIAEIKGGRDILILAARCQHLERFKSARSSYPEGKAGYLKWRRDLYTIQSNRAKELLIQAGVSEEEGENVRIWVSKTDLKPGKEGGIWGTQVSSK